MTKNHWIGVLLGIICFWMVGCDVTITQWERAEELCKNNRGVYSVRADNYQVRCLNGATFSYSKGGD